MFRAILCSSSGGSTVYTQHLVLYVSLFLCDRSVHRQLDEHNMARNMYRNLHRMLASIPWLQSALNFFLNRILISTKRTHNNTWTYEEGRQQCRVSHNHEDCYWHLSCSTGIATRNSKNYDQMGITFEWIRQRTVLQTTFYNLAYTERFETSHGVLHTGT